jgi:hypothetical protein
MATSSGDEVLLKQNRKLQEELMRQWMINHHEHCGVIIPPWPHPGRCHWPMPKILNSSALNSLGEQELCV